MSVDPSIVPAGLESLPENWEFHHLDELCEGIFDCPHSTPKISESGPLMVRTQDILSGVFRTENAASVSDETYRNRISRAEPQFGDLLYSREGTYFGIAAEVPKGIRVCLGQRMVLIRPKPGKIYFQFLKYWLNSPQVSNHVRGHRDGSVAERLNMPTIRKLPVAAPPLPDQLAIASILSSLDDKIETNRRMNAVLEEMARAIFRAWFVDFEPVRAKAAGATHFPGMPQEVFDSLPNRLVSSELGEIPEGWESRSISELGRFVNGKAFTKHANNQGRMIIRIAEINSGPGTSTKYSDVDAELENTAYPGDILFSWSGTLGVSRWYRDEAIINQHIFKVIPEAAPAWYAFYRLEEAMPFFRQIASTKATTMGHIRRVHLDESKFLHPPAAYVGAAGNAIEPLFKTELENNRQSLDLTNVRDAILPKLISGDLPIPDSTDG